MVRTFHGSPLIMAEAALEVAAEGVPRGAVAAAADVHVQAARAVDVGLGVAAQRVQRRLDLRGGLRRISFELSRHKLYEDE